MVLAFGKSLTLLEFVCVFRFEMVLLSQVVNSSILRFFDVNSVLE